MGTSVQKKGENIMTSIRYRRRHGIYTCMLINENYRTNIIIILMECKAQFLIEVTEHYKEDWCTYSHPTENYRPIGQN